MATRERSRDAEAEARAFRTEIQEVLRFPAPPAVREKLVRELGPKTYYLIRRLMTCPDETARAEAVALYAAHVRAADFQRHGIVGTTGPMRKELSP